MPPRIAYWTSAFEPDIEAIAAEVAMLRRRFADSVAWGLSYRHWALASQRRGYCVNPRFHLFFRVMTRVLEPAFQLNHIFGSLGDWHYLRGVRRRPTVLTVAACATPVAPSLLERVDQFVVEYPGAREQLRRMGIDDQRIRLVYPPVALERFCPVARQEGRFTVLFASSPPEADWLPARGVPHILDAAALRPNMHFRLLWRPWGDSAGRVRQWIAERGLGNVELQVMRCKDMATCYRAADVTIAPFTEMNMSKPAPNSLIESLACGRPVVVTAKVGLSELIQESGAGRICDPTGASLAEELDRLEADWPTYSGNARRVAETCFCAVQFLARYEQLYGEVLRKRM